MLSNGIYAAASRAILLLASFACIRVVSLYLEPASFAVFLISLSAVGGSMLVDFGLPMIALGGFARAQARDPDEAPEIIVDRSAAMATLAGSHAGRLELARAIAPRHGFGNIDRTLAAPFFSRIHARHLRGPHRR